MNDTNFADTILSEQAVTLEAHELDAAIAQCEAELFDEGFNPEEVYHLLYT